MSQDAYEQFIESKCHRVQPVGFEPQALPAKLFDYQRDIVRWACVLGRAAIWADCGLGKSFCQLSWASEVCRETGGDVLILAPLAVSPQTVAEGEKLGIKVHLCRTQADVQPGVNITNYEMLEHFDAGHFVGVVLDESSCIKHHDAKRRTLILEAFRSTRFKLACTATPAPNDFMELGNHAEFLGVMSRTEMLATFFVHDGGETSKWRLKGHAETEFWKWLCEWAVMLRKPSDLGYSDEGFTLPPLEMHQLTVKGDHRQAQKAGLLFAMEAQTLDERRAARKGSIDERVREVAALVNGDADPSEQWLIWCGLNDEANAIQRAIPGAVQVSGDDSREVKEQVARDFAAGKVRVLVSKVSIFGFGMNFQSCRNVVFVGLSDSWEQFYQAVRRSWRFGQKRTVRCWIATSELEGAVVKNIQRKEADAARLVDEMVRHMAAISASNLKATSRRVIDYRPAVPMQLPAWLRSAA
jgi:superfamily II DNA or RNA helicase